MSSDIRHTKCDIRAEGEEPELYCPKCRIFKPLTTEFWWRNKYYASGWHECGCKECELKNKRLKMHKNGVFVDDSIDDFDDFAHRAMADGLKRILEPSYSFER